MKSLPFIFCVTSFVVFSNLTLAYEVATHEEMSQKAVEFSALFKDATLLQDIGLQPVSNKQKFPNSSNVSKDISSLFRDGARFEDTLSLTRPMNHFYDPRDGSGLYAWSGLIKGVPSPDWALEDKGEIAGNQQQFSYKDAREFFYKALTGRVLPDGSVLANQAERDKYFGLTFQTLGQVIHHIQDMAQPQHVRNDMHLDIPKTGEWPFIPNLPGENPSLYESWTNQFEVRKSLPTNFFAAGYDLNALKFTSTFNQPRKFWASTTGEGLAQFTNHNFVSAGTNFDNSGLFNSPIYTVSWYVDKDIKQLCSDAVPKCPNQNLSGKMRFYANWVEDSYTGAAKPNSMASTYSMFDPELEKINSKKTFSLNRFNFTEAYSFLIPRAIAYSAGLINYFFRGKIEFKADSNNPGRYVIKNLGSEDMKGTFTLYYDAKDGKRYPVGGDMPSETWVNRSIAANGELGNLSFTRPLNPVPKTPGNYILVFNGDMGEEKSIQGSTVGAVAATMVRPPSRIAFVRYDMDTFMNEIYVITLLGEEKVLSRLTNTMGWNNNESPAWSPDGSRIAFASDRYGDNEIYIMNVEDGDSHLIRLTDPEGKMRNRSTRPTWSPDGKRIAYVSMQDGNSEVYIANADGTGEIINLTKNPAQDYYPSWSPDGSKIAFVSERDGNGEIYSINVNDGSLMRLTNYDRDDWTPAWSPDGSKIAFARNISSTGFNFEIFVMNADGSGVPRNLTNHPDNDHHPTWSPDGTQIAFTTYRNINSEIYIMNADGSMQKNITNYFEQDFHPSWAPN